MTNNLTGEKSIESFGRRDDIEQFIRIRTATSTLNAAGDFLVVSLSPFSRTGIVNSAALVPLPLKASFYWQGMNSEL